MKNNRYNIGQVTYCNFYYCKCLPSNEHTKYPTHNPNNIYFVGAGGGGTCPQCRPRLCYCNKFTANLSGAVAMIAAMTALEDEPPIACIWERTTVP